MGQALRRRCKLSRTLYKVFAAGPSQFSEELENGREERETATQFPRVHIDGKCADRGTNAESRDAVFTFYRGAHLLSHVQRVEQLLPTPRRALVFLWKQAGSYMYGNMRVQNCTTQGSQFYCVLQDMRIIESWKKKKFYTL